MLGMLYRDRECSRRLVMKKECYSAWQEIKKKTADYMYGKMIIGALFLDEFWN